MTQRVAESREGKGMLRWISDFFFFFFFVLREGCARGACMLQCNGAALAGAVLRSRRTDSRRSVPFVGGDVVLRRDGARR